MPRTTEWKDNIVSFNLATGAGAFESLVVNFSEPDKRGMTLVRTLLRLNFFSTSIAGAYGVQIVSLGIAVAFQEAFAVGLTALSDPQTESDRPIRGWVYRTQVAPSQNGIGTPLVTSLTADIRAARKLENGELYVTSFSAAGVGTTFTVAVTGLIRTLFKLP